MFDASILIYGNRKKDYTKASNKALGAVSVTV